jgi:CRISPR-associated protein Cmr1
LETSIIGSLRWWLEALARGYGINVPEIRSQDGEAEADHAQDETADGEAKPKGIDAFFGCTAQKRAFRVDIEAGSVAEVSIPGKVRLPAARANDPRPGWFFKGERAFKASPPNQGNPRGTLKLRLIATDLDAAKAESVIRIIEGLLTFISQFGALGARTQHGFGIIGYKSAEGISALVRWLDSQPAAMIGTVTSSQLPSIGNFFHLSVPVRAAVREPHGEDGFMATLRLRRQIRDGFRNAGEDDLRHQVMGWVKGDDRQGSRISVSLPYEDGRGHRIRIWGWDDDPDLVARRIYGCVPGSPPYLVPSEGYKTKKYVERLIDEAAQ